MARSGGGVAVDNRRILVAVNEALEQQPVDVVRLRKIAAVCGLATNSLRARVWPVLLGVRTDEVDREAFAAASLQRHKDTGTVEARAHAHHHTIHCTCVPLPLRTSYPTETDVCAALVSVSVSSDAPTCVVVDYRWTSSVHLVHSRGE